MVQPGIARRLQPPALQSYSPFTGCFLKHIRPHVDFMHHIILSHPQTQHIVFQPVEVEHLVYQLQHGLHALPYHGQFAVHGCRQAAIGIQGRYRPGNQGKRIAKLVGDVGKETHVHFIRTPLALLVSVGQLQCHAVGTNAQVQVIDIDHQPGKQQHVARQSRHRQPRRLSHNKGNGFLLNGFRAQRLQSAHPETVLARRQVGVRSLMVATCRNPVAVKTLQFIYIGIERRVAKVHTAEINLHIILVISQHIIPFIRGNARLGRASLRMYTRRISRCGSMSCFMADV